VNAALAILQGAPMFPGATLALDAEGQIVHAWLGDASPIDEASGDVFTALGVDDATADAARVQLLLASAWDAPASSWAVLVVDAPPMLVRRDGTPLATMWQPIIRGGTIEAIAMFVVAGEGRRMEADDPVELNRICVDALALLDECDACLRHLRGEPTARHAVHRMFRAVHTIKGSTRGTQQRGISDLAHAVEEALDILRRSDESAPAGAVGQLEQDLRRLRAAVTAARPRGEVDDAMTELLSECRSALADLHAGVERLREPARDRSANEPAPRPSFTNLGGDSRPSFTNLGADSSALDTAIRSVDRIAGAAERAQLRALRIQCTAARNALAMIADGEPDPALLAEVAALAAHLELYAAVYREVAASDAGPSMLVTLASWMDAPEDRSGTFDGLGEVMSQAGVPSLINAFVDMADPYAIRRALAVLTDAQAMFEPARPRDDASLRFERAQRDLLAAIEGLARDVPFAPLAEIRAIVQRLVWTPLAVIARRIVRMTRTLGAELGKNVVAEIDLGDHLVAPEIGRLIGEILVHAVRNAADHGIEMPGDRVAAGKDPAGTIRVSAAASGEWLVVTVSDDGCGISVEKVRRTAIARGLLDPDQAHDATDAEVLDLLFTPGFSTSAVVTAVSGRGVGMDVIKSLAEEQGGSVTLTSHVGFGTELSLQLPFAPR
jgi:two-component system, chemotaxis family, sensor kinase CheA